MGCPARWLLVAGLAACAHEHDDLQYRWDDRQVLCSMVLDDYLAPVDWDRVNEQLQFAASHDSVALFHAHVPEITISRDTLEKFFALTGEHRLDFVTYSELSPRSEPRAAVALAFDDHTVADWFAQRPLFAAHGSRLTFFITFLDR